MPGGGAPRYRRDRGVAEVAEHASPVRLPRTVWGEDGGGRTGGKTQSAGAAAVSGEAAGPPPERAFSGK
ncbi:hypothetical protein Misp03_20290 [Microbispora sp. NBRC 16548]|nr:hypothetical protein Misp03_20290 [Microbispora sp. NBRC 16548]